jgi:hypothetical protein
MLYSLAYTVIMCIQLLTPSTPDNSDACSRYCRYWVCVVCVTLTSPYNWCWRCQVCQVFTANDPSSSIIFVLLARSCCTARRQNTGRARGYSASILGLHGRCTCSLYSIECWLHQQWQHHSQLVSLPLGRCMTRTPGRGCRPNQSQTECCWSTPQKPLAAQHTACLQGNLGQNSWVRLALAWP